MQDALEFFDILLKVPHLDSTFKQLLDTLNIFYYNIYSIPVSLDSLQNINHNQFWLLLQQKMTRK